MRLRKADAYVVSLQKSGRTWLRVFLSTYLHYWKEHHAAAAPHICYSHDVWEHYAKQKLGERVRGKWLIPPRCAATKRKLLLVRDPRDQLVSLYYHLKKRNVPAFPGTLTDLIYHPLFGMERIVQIMNRWIREWQHNHSLLLLHYETMNQNPTIAFEAAVKFLLPNHGLDRNLFELALRISSFENMRMVEAGDANAKGASLLRALGFCNDILKPRNQRDLESYKVRERKVGSYQLHFAAEELAYLNQHLTMLDPRFGYPSTHSA